MKRILFFVAVLLIFSCSQESKIQKSDPESYPAQVDRLVIDTRQRAERLGVEWTGEEAEELRETFLGSSTAKEKAEAIIQVNHKIAEQYRIAETKKMIVETGISDMEKALDWRTAKLQKMAEDPQIDPRIRVNAQDTRSWLMENRASQLQSAKDELSRLLDENGVRVPSNGELIRCLRKCVSQYEQCYRGCDILDTECWNRCMYQHIACVATCPGMASSMLK